MPFLCSLTVPQQEFFFLDQVIKQVRGGKEVVRVQFVAKSFYPLVRLVTVAWVAVRCCAAFCCLYRGKHSCHMYIQ